MLPRELVRQIRRLQIRRARAVEDLLGGEYRSVFKGTGVSFEEVREYQPGDDIRAIDWNVTARMGHPFVKRFIEERELTVMLLVDVSASQAFGTQAQTKRAVAGELAALLAFSAISNNDKVGLILASDRVEKFIPPRKGARHVLRLMRDILFYEPEHPGTCLREGFDFLNRVLRRRAIVFCFSDFIDQEYEKAFKRTSRRHDLVAVAQGDPRERDLPDVGLLEIEDAETGQQLLVDTSNALARRTIQARGTERSENFRQLARSARVDVIEVSTEGRHLDSLLSFFRRRERRLGRA